MRLNKALVIIKQPDVARALWGLWGLVALILLPIISLILIALQGDFHDLIPLFQTVLPKTLITTLILMALVAIGTSLIGVTSAWLVVHFDFPYRKTLTGLLVLPLALAPYISAYCYVDFLHFTGPLQTGLRHILHRSDYWFFEIRTVWGAGFILSFALYPYVYLASYVFFLMQTRNVTDMARVLGASNSVVFFKIMLPMARPALLAGVSLALMETLNDIGASEYLGVQTLTFSVYHTWLAQNNLTGAAQLALIVFIIVSLLLALEAYSRRLMRFHTGRGAALTTQLTRVLLPKPQAWGAFLIVLLPVIFGFMLPVAVLVKFASKRLYQFFESAFLEALLNSMSVGVCTASIVMLICVCLLHVSRFLKRKHRLFIRLCALGYALPGTVLALGALYMFAFVDTQLNTVSKFLFDYKIGLFFSSSIAAIIFVCSIRFIAVGETSLSAAVLKLPENLDLAARNLGASPLRSTGVIVLPLLKPALLSSFILIFVDTVKELSATLLLRPVGFNTLATLVYENASRAAVEDGAAAALCIVMVSIIPVFLISRTLSKG